MVESGEFLGGAQESEECAPGRTRATEGHGRRLIFRETRNGVRPISGFAKNGDASVCLWNLPSASVLIFNPFGNHGVDFPLEFLKWLTVKLATRVLIA